MHVGKKEGGRSSQRYLDLSQIDSKFIKKIVDHRLILSPSLAHSGQPDPLAQSSRLQKSHLTKTNLLKTHLSSHISALSHLDRSQRNQLHQNNLQTHFQRVIDKNLQRQLQGQYWVLKSLESSHLGSTALTHKQRAVRHHLNNTRDRIKQVMSLSRSRRVSEGSGIGGEAGELEGAERVGNAQKRESDQISNGADDACDPGDNHKVFQMEESEGRKLKLRKTDQIFCMDILSEIQKNFSGQLPAHGSKKSNNVKDKNANSQVKKKKFVDYGEVRAEEDQEIEEMRQQEQAQRRESMIDSEDSLDTKRKKMEADIERKKKLQTLERMKKMREDLLKQPDMDFSKMSKQMREYLRERDYDSYFFESIAVNNNQFDEQFELFTGNKADYNPKSDKLAKRIEAKRKQMNQWQTERFLLAKNNEDCKAYNCDGGANNKKWREELNTDQRRKLQDLVNLNEDDLEYIVREGQTRYSMNKMLSKKSEKFMQDVFKEIHEEKHQKQYIKQTKLIKKQLLKEQKERERKLEDFLNQQQIELNDCLRKQVENDPERIVEIKRKRQLIKMKTKAALMTKLESTPDWHRRLQNNLARQLKKLSNEQILIGDTSSLKLPDLTSRYSPLRTRSRAMEPMSPRSPLSPLKDRGAILSQGSHVNFSKGLVLGKENPIYSSAQHLVPPQSKVHVSSILEQISELQQDMTGNQSICSDLQSDVNPHQSQISLQKRSQSNFSNKMYQESNHLNTNHRSSIATNMQNFEAKTPAPRLTQPDQQYTEMSYSEFEDEVVSLTNSENSQDLKNFERKIKEEITEHQIGQYNIRCDKSIIKQAFLKGSSSSKDNIMSNLQKKFNINDRMISPFTELDPKTDYDPDDPKKSILSKIINAEKNLKLAVQKSAQKASIRAQQESINNESCGSLIIGLNTFEKQQATFQKQRQKNIQKLESALLKYDPEALHLAQSSHVNIQTDKLCNAYKISANNQTEYS